jgi:hypothetical protein
MLLDYLTRLIHCQNEVTPLFLYFFVYNHILDDRISPNRTRRNVIVYEEMQSKMKAVDEVYLSINDRISVHTITELYDRNIESCDHISSLTSVSI